MLDLSRLVEAQKTLDEHIMNEHPELRGQNNLLWKVLAFQVEVAECANEWRGFKKWSHDQEPRIEALISCDQYSAELWKCGRYTECGAEFYEFIERCPICGWDTILPFRKLNPLLEEYVDGLHFLLSIGLESDIGTFSRDELAPSKMDSIEMQFISLFEAASRFIYDINYYPEMWELFLGLGERLGFTWEQIEEAYFRKNSINHERQEKGY